MILKHALLLVILVVSCSSVLSAQKDKIEGIWFNDEKTGKIEIYKARDSKFYGKIIWLKEPVVNGKPRTDEKNSDATLRDKPLIGSLILKGFVKNGENAYKDGTIYDPKNGKTYDCKITHKGETLDIRGYIGISLLGRTTTWTKAD